MGPRRSRAARRPAPTADAVEEDSATRAPGSRTPGERSRGLRLTESLLPLFGPAQVGDPGRSGRGLTDEERSRIDRLSTGLRRVTGPDGRSYVVSAEDPPS